MSAVDSCVLVATRRILNETRQDRVLRGLLDETPEAEILPFLGSLDANYCFLGLCPSGVIAGNIPQKAESYIRYAQRYFSREESEKQKFEHYLPLTSNHTKNYQIFGEVSWINFLVPVTEVRANRIQMEMIEACWERWLELLDAVRPKSIFVHGSLLWDFLSEGSQEIKPPLKVDLDFKNFSIREVYDKVEPSELFFQSSIDGLDPDYKPWWMVVPNLMSSGYTKEVRAKMETAQEMLIKSALSDAKSVVISKEGVRRIRIRRPQSDD